MGGGESAKHQEIEERKSAFRAIDASARKSIADEEDLLQTELKHLFEQGAKMEKEETKETDSHIRRRGIPDYLAKITISSITFTIFHTWTQKIIQLVTQRQKVFSAHHILYRL